MNGQAPGAIHSSSSFSHFPSLYLHFLGFFLRYTFPSFFFFSSHLFFFGGKNKTGKNHEKKIKKIKKEETQQTPKKYGGGSHTFHFRGPPFLFTVSNCFDSSAIES
jgi:hypothetical protein